MCCTISSFKEIVGPVEYIINVAIWKKFKTLIDLGFEFLVFKVRIFVYLANTS